MSKRIPEASKIAAYNDAIDFLHSMESESDVSGDKEAREWLAAKLDKECDRWLKGRNRSNDI